MESFFKNERMRLGLTQVQVASICNVSERTVINWEGGKAISSDKLKILSCYDFDVLYIVTGHRNKNIDIKDDERTTSLKNIVKWLQSFGANADEKKWHWLEIQMQNNFPDYNQWLSKQK